MQAETPDETAARKSKFFRKVWCNYIGIIAGLAVVAPIVVMLLDRREPVHLYQGSLIPEIVNPGQTVVVMWEADELRRGCDGVFERRIIEKKTGKVHQFKREPTAYHMIGPGERQTFTREFTLPDSITPGPAEYSTIGERWCNVLQKYLWPIPFSGPVVPFTVIERPSPPPIILSPSFAPEGNAMSSPTPKAKRAQKRSKR